MKIQLKRSSVLNGGSAKEPTAEQMEYGELAVNYNATDPSVFIKDSSDNIVKIADTTPPGDGTITIKQPGSPDQSFTVNQTGNTEINLKNDNTQVTPGNGALSIQSFGSGDTSSGTFTANQAGLGTVTLPQISFTDLKNVPPAAAAPGNGTITITQPGTNNQTFTVNQTGNTTIALKNDNTVVTPGNGALTIKTAGEGASASGTFTANQSGASTITLPTIRYGDLSGRPSIPAAAGNGTITITQPGTNNQTFTVNQTGNTTIALKNDNTVVTPGNGALTIKTAGEGASATGTFTANQGGASTITLPTIRYGDLSGRPTIPAAAGNGTITIKQPGTTDQTFTVNQSGNTTVNLRNDNTVPSVGNGTITITQPGVNNQTFTVNQSGNTTIALKNDNTNTTYSAGVGLTLSGTEFSTDSTIPRLNMNNSFGGRQTFLRASVTDNLRFNDGAQAQFFDNSPNNIGFTSVIEQNRCVISGGTETTSGSAVQAFQNSLNFAVNGGTNTLNIFPCGFKSVPTVSTFQIGNYAHYLAQGMAVKNSGSVKEVFGFAVLDAAMLGTVKNYGFFSRVPANGNKNYNFYATGDAPNFFQGNVTSNGTIGFSGRFNVRMDADNPASYTTTYRTELDDDLNEFQIEEEEYTGPTEDLATMITSVRTRLSAIETATTASSESESNALFTLLADLSSRVAALEAGS